MSKKKIVIDTDCGLDDAKAIMIAASRNDIEILAITCVNGNTIVDNVVVNVLRTLEACGKTQIPVHRGADMPVLGNFSFQGAVDFHGKDGFGDVPNLPLPSIGPQGEHAVQTLIKIAHSYPDEVTLVALGPLTNVALAIRMDRSFSMLWKGLFIMGGNTEGQGNVTVSAEANFCYDPEAAYVVLNEMQCSITIAPWEMCLRHVVDWNTRKKLLEADTKQAKLISAIEHKVEDHSNFNGYVLCDEFAVAAAVETAVVLKQSKPFYASVEVSGNYTRGQMIIDRQNILKKDANVRMIEEIDMEVMLQLLSKALS